MKKIQLLFLSFLIVVFCVHGQTAIEKEIISDLIEAEFGSVSDESSINGEDKKESSIIILSETITQSLDTKMNFLRKGLNSLDLYTMNDFIKRNLNSVIISEFNLEQIKIIYISQKEYERIMDQGGWNLYHKIYGYIPTITLSRPGINESIDEALIYYDAISDKLGGAGFYLLLEKVNNKWIIKEKIIAWMS